MRGAMNVCVVAVGLGLALGATGCAVEVPDDDGSASEAAATVAGHACELHAPATSPVRCVVTAPRGIQLRQGPRIDSKDLTVPGYAIPCGFVLTMRSEPADVRADRGWQKPGPAGPVVADGGPVVYDPRSYATSKDDLVCSTWAYVHATYITGRESLDDAEFTRHEAAGFVAAPYVACEGPERTLDDIVRGLDSGPRPACAPAARLWRTLMTP